jgi:hypothetical protein
LNELRKELLPIKTDKIEGTNGINMTSHMPPHYNNETYNMSGEWEKKQLNSTNAEMYIIFKLKEGSFVNRSGDINKVSKERIISCIDRLESNLKEEIYEAYDDANGLDYVIDYILSTNTISEDNKSELVEYFKTVKNNLKF